MTSKLERILAIGTLSILLAVGSAGCAAPGQSSQRVGAAVGLVTGVVVGTQAGGRGGHRVGRHGPPGRGNGALGVLGGLIGAVVGSVVGAQVDETRRAQSNEAAQQELGSSPVQRW